MARLNTEDKMGKMNLADRIKQYKFPIIESALAGLAIFFLVTTADAAYNRTSLLDIVRDLPRSIGWDLGSISAGTLYFARKITNYKS